MSWWDVIGCNSFASWLLALAKTCKKHLLYFNFISARPHICNEKKNKISAQSSRYLTFI